MTSIAIPSHLGARGGRSTSYKQYGALSAWADLAFARARIQECVSQHDDCHPVLEGAVLQALHPPTRFIDTKMKRLVALDEIISSPLEFVALSYVWGQEYQLRTTSANIHEF